MTRTNKFDEIYDKSSISPRWTAINNEFCIAERTAGESITAYRAVKICGNNQIRRATRKDSHFYGAPVSRAGYDRKDTALIVTRGPAELAAQGGRIEAQQEFKIAKDGKITKIIKSSPARSILSATNGEAGEITETDANDEKIKVKSASSDDSSYWALVIGKQKTTGNAIFEYINTGTSYTTGNYYFDELYAVVLVDAPNIYGTATEANGDITVVNNTSETALATVSSGSTHVGLIAVSDGEAYDSYVYATIDSLAAAEVIIVGEDENGDEVGDIITFAAANDIVTKESTERFKEVKFVAGGGVADARTIALAARRNHYIADGWTNNVGHVTYTSGNQEANAKQKVKSDEASDSGMKIKLIGYDDSTVVQNEITLNGTTPVEAGTATDVILGGYVSSGTPTGTISILNNDGSTVVGTFDAATYNSWGLVEPDEADVTTGVKSALDIDCGNGKVTITNSNGSCSDKVILVGYDTSGSAQTELLTLSSGAATSTNDFSRLDYIASISGATTEHYRISLNTDDTVDAKGIVLVPSDAADDNLEVFIY